MSELARTEPRHGQLRDEVICRCAVAARWEAYRYRHCSEPMDDLIQVASLALVLAVDRFQTERGIAFKHFAVPTIRGELKRHFRDSCWSVKATRRMQELYVEIRAAAPLVTQQLGRTPTVSDLATHLQISADDVALGQSSEAAFSAWSLNHPAHVGEDGEFGDNLGGPDPGIDQFADRDALRQAWPLLPERLRVILSMRYVDELSQVEIADKLGMSQVHISRLIKRSLDTLRRNIDQPEA